MSFFSIVPEDLSYVANNSSGITLRVARDVDLNFEPDLDITVTRLNNGYKHFFNPGSMGGKFKIDVVFYKSESKVMEQLDNIIRNMIPVKVNTEATDIPNGSYIITDNGSRKQSFKNTTRWELEFTTFVALNVVKYKNDNAAILKALKLAARNGTKTPVEAKLAKCDYKTLKYSKKKKVVKCVKYMQKILYKHKFLAKKQIDGWYGKETAKAVKKFQQAWNKKKIKVHTPGYTGVIVDAGKLVTKTNNQNIALPKNAKITKKQSKKNKSSTIKTQLVKQLKVNGKVDELTFKALCKG